ncbi:hypothetical protein CPB86DRAFT_254476 [Serendipita vermifera]|nr:hypothetical protein CPB86DRAFT_254476 [Serendipita vermifera]
MLSAIVTFFSILALQAAAQQEDIVSIGPAIEFDAIHNVSSIAGSWSSGSGHVQTGSGFCNPVQSTFETPATAGIAYSFTEDGYFEEALYRFTGNGTDPRCVVALLQFQHGGFQLLNNGSIVLKPFAQDGRQQVQNPCTAESNVLRQFNQTTLFQSWRIFRDPQGRDKLHLFRFDGAPFAPMFRVTDTPNMLPTRVLTNTTIGAVANSKRSLDAGLEKRSSSDRTSSVAMAGLFAASLMSVAVSLL